MIKLSIRADREEITNIIFNNQKFIAKGRATCSEVADAILLYLIENRTEENGIQRKKIEKEIDKLIESKKESIKGFREGIWRESEYIVYLQEVEELKARILGGEK